MQTIKIKSYKMIKKDFEKIGFIETDIVNEDGIHEVNLKITL